MVRNILGNIGVYTCVCMYICIRVCIRKYVCMYIRGSLNNFPDFFRMGTFIDSTHMKL